MSAALVCILHSYKTHQNSPPPQKNCWQVTAKSLQSMETFLNVELSQDSWTTPRVVALFPKASVSMPAKTAANWKMPCICACLSN